MSLSRGFLITDLGSGLDVNWSPHNVFKKSISVNTTLSFSNIEDKMIFIIVNNTSGSDRSIFFPAMTNSSDITTNVRAGTTTVFMFANAGTDLFCLGPVRSQALYA